jgi:hypothetical protein
LRKLNEYYNRLDDAPVYTAALALHPKNKMRWIRKKLGDRPKWIQKAEASLEELWAIYKNKELREAEKIEQQRGAEEVK